MMITCIECFFKCKAVLVEKILGNHAGKAVLWAERTAWQPIYHQEFAADFQNAFYFEGQIVAIFLFDLKESVGQMPDRSNLRAVLCRR